MNEIEQNHAFMNLLGELETRFPVHEWTVDSVRVWPIARMHLYYGFFEHQYFANRPARAGLIKLADLPRVGLRIAKSAWRYVSSSVTDFRNTHHRNHPHDAVFLNYQTYMTPLNGRWYSRVCDPFVEQLSARGWSSFMLTGGYEYATPRLTKSRFIQPHLVFHRLLGMIDRRRGEPSPLLRELEAAAKVSGLFSASFVLLDPVARHARQIRAISRYFKRVLAEVRPKLVLVTCWYATESMACLLACSELGIPSVDIQHGSQEFHVAYDRWTRVPPGGYELLPTCFWCWSEAEASVIRAWAGPLSVHTPIVGANLFLERWVVGQDEVVRAYDRILTGLKEPSKGKVQILYTLNGSTKEEINTIVEIIEAVNKSGLESHFWIRLHPIALDQRGRVRRTLEQHGLRNVDVDNATTLPLYAILRHMDVHITEFSSVVIEAQALGVPSVTGEQGVIWFPNQVATGWAVMARSIAEWVSGIRLQLDRRQTLVAGHSRSAVSSAKALDELLDVVRNTAPHQVEEPVP
ncbi:MAG: hypothetical protein WD690_00340 [Vicinamibacterales bacterium]